MGIGPALLRPFFQARPPDEKAQVRRVRERRVKKIKSRMEMSRRFLDPSKAGRVKIHQFVSFEISIFSSISTRVGVWCVKKKKKRVRVIVLKDGRVVFVVQYERGGGQGLYRGNIQHHVRFFL